MKGAKNNFEVGAIVRLKSGGPKMTMTQSSGAAGQHTSETEQASIPDGAFDTVIQNDGTLAELGEAVAKWMMET